MQRYFYLYVNALSDIGSRMHLIGITALIALTCLKRNRITS